MWRPGIAEQQPASRRDMALAPRHWRVPASAMMAVWALAMLAMPPASAQDAPGLSGPYRVVAVRASSPVPSPHDAQASLERNELIGTTVNFDETSVWFDGSVCVGDRVPVAADPPLLWTADPNLSDLQVNPGEEDRRLNQGTDDRLWRPATLLDQADAHNRRPRRRCHDLRGRGPLCDPREAAA